MKNLNIFCITNKRIKFLENFHYNLAWVGQEKSPENYIKCDSKKNIFYKEKNYSELTFQYWYWKNLLNLESNNWVGFCQKRRFWIKPNINHKDVNLDNIEENLLTEIPIEWNNFESIICKPIKISGAKKIKIIKRGWRNLVRDPLILLDEKKENIALHFDMHHGYGNLSKAITLVNREDRSDFFNYVNTSTSYNPHIMFIAKPKIVNKWFETLFSWLFECEKIFKFDELKGYDTQRLFAYLAERYLSFWFKKHTNFVEKPWIFIDQ